MSASPALDPEQIAELMELRLEHGWSQQALADRYIMNPGSISKIIKRHMPPGMEQVNHKIHMQNLSRVQWKVGGPERTMIVDLYNNRGWTLDRLSKRFGISISTTSRIVRAAKGLKRPDRWSASGVPNVRYRNGKFFVRPRVGGVQHWVGTFDTRDDAVAALNRWKESL